ncbi:MAG: hypothetical protein LUF33_04460 [Clostridiales bacterium]|nr:hypothetical protein [Clostridiales bacterium]
MISERRNTLFYVCALIEYVSRETTNHRRYVVEKIGKAGMQKLFKDASVNHCLTFEQVSTEVIEQYCIETGSYDTISNCKYSIPSFIDIGKVYAYLTEILSVDESTDVDTVMGIFESFLSDEISNFKTGIYFENLSYLSESFKAGKLLDF